MGHILHRSSYGKKLAADQLRAVATKVRRTAGAGVAAGSAVGRAMGERLGLVKPKRPRKHRRTIWDYLRPRQSGVISGAADNDPSGIVTYTQTGAVAGLGLLWTVIFSLPMLIVVEEMSARIGIVTKKGLNHVIRDRFGQRHALFSGTIVALCNILTVGANLAFMAQILSIFTGLSSAWWVALLGLGLLLMLLRKGYAVISRFLLILTPLFFLYVVAAFLVPNIPWWPEVALSTILPHVEWTNLNFIMIALGVFGTTVSPYLIFWQTTEEIEEHKRVKDIDDESMGVISGMIFTQLIFFFIVLVSALVLHGQVGAITTAEQAALALRPLAGEWSFLLFSLGILASGLLAVPVLTATTAYVVADTYGWQEGLDKEQSQAAGFYTVIILALVAAVGIALSGLSPVLMLVYSQVLNGILVPVLLLYVIKIANDGRVMGRYTNTKLSNLVAWFTVLVMGTLTLLMFYSFIIKP